MNVFIHAALNWKRATQLLLVFLAMTVFGLWAMNTISELFAGPVAEYKHVVASLILLLTIRWSLLSHR